MAYAPFPVTLTNAAAATGVQFDADLLHISAKTFSVKDFGALGDGVTDDTAAINAAIAYVNAISTSVSVGLHFSPGRYLTSSPSNLTAFTRGNLSIMGYGAELYVQGAANGGFLFFNSGNPVSNVRIAGLRISSSTTGGIGIYFFQGSGITLSDVDVNNMATGIRIQSISYILLSNLSTSNCTNGLYILNTLGVLVSNGHIDGGGSGAFKAGTKGIVFDGNASGNLFQNLDITTCEYGVYINAGAAQAVQYNYFSRVLTDTSNYGFYAVASGGGVVQGIFASNCWFSSNHVDGVYLDGAVGVTISGATNIFLNGSCGVNIRNAKNVRVSDCNIQCNNGQTTGSPGVNVLDSSTVAICDNIFTNNSTDWPGNAANQNLGISLNGAPDDLVICDNQFKAHGTLDIQDLMGARPTRATIRGNTTSRSNIFASASSITPEIVFDVVHLSGVTAVDNILTNGIPGKELMIVTDGICLINSTFNFKLAGGAGFAGTAGSALTLWWNRTNTSWSEKARSIL